MPRSNDKAATFICLLRAVNVGGRNQIRMDALKEICTSLDLTDVQTHLQSGNVIFRSPQKDPALLGEQLEKAIEREAGIDIRIMLRTPKELRAAIAANPLQAEAEREPKGFVINFLADAPSKAAQASLLESYRGPEKIAFGRREMYIYYGAGMGRSKLTNALMERKLGTAGTARNWNTVVKLLSLAEALD